MREEKIGDKVRFRDCLEENHNLNDDPPANQFGIRILTKKSDGAIGQKLLMIAYDNLR